MTDLIKQWDDYIESMGSVMGEVEHMAQQMRDRIEDLEARNKELTLQLLATSGQAADALDKLANATKIGNEDRQREMTDLIKRLRRGNNGQEIEAADRIEELMKERDKFREVFGTSSLLLGETELQLEAAEAKLTKAGTLALETILNERGPVFDAMVDAAEDAAGKGVSFNVVVGRAIRAALAELEK